MQMKQQSTTAAAIDAADIWKDVAAGFGMAEIVVEGTTLELDVEEAEFDEDGTSVRSSDDVSLSASVVDLDGIEAVVGDGLRNVADDVATGSKDLLSCVVVDSSVDSG
jgi:hypothetical protein